MLKKSTSFQVSVKLENKIGSGKAINSNQILKGGGVGLTGQKRRETTEF